MYIDREKMPLLANPIPFDYECDRCFDTGFWLNFAGFPAPCPRIGNSGHPFRNKAATMVWLFVEKLPTKPTQMAFDLARVLTHFTSDQPCDTRKVLDYFFADTSLTHGVQLRKLAYLVEDLRSVWRLPVGSRKEPPAGYWIITDLEDCKAWLRLTTSAPKTQLVTIWKAAKAAFPVLADQQEFDFLDSLDEASIESISSIPSIPDQEDGDV